MGYHSVHQLCGRKLGIDAKPFKHDEVVVYNDGANFQVSPTGSRCRAINRAVLWRVCSHVPQEGHCAKSAKVGGQLL